MRFLVYAVIGLAVAVFQVAALWVSLAAGAPNPRPTLRPARPGEVESAETTAKRTFLRAKFPGAVRVPRECSWERTDSSDPPTAYKLRLTCTPMELERP